MIFLFVLSIVTFLELAIASVMELLIYFTSAVTGMFCFGAFLITLDEDHILHHEFDDIYTF